MLSTNYEMIAKANTRLKTCLLEAVVADAHRYMSCRRAWFMSVYINISIYVDIYIYIPHC